MSDDIRVGDLIRPYRDRKDVDPGFTKPCIVIVGFPFDEGVRRNGGRVGASFGPVFFRRAVTRLGTVPNPATGVDLREIGLYDIGDVPTAGMTLEAAHEWLKGIVLSLLRQNAVPFVVGGGNDQSFANGSALLEHAAGKSIGVINVDAHLDVRELKDGKTHSGSPFRQLLESDGWRLSSFAEFAAQGEQCSAAHARYLQDKGHDILWLDSVLSDPVEHFRRVLDRVSPPRSSHTAPVFVSFDIDSIASSDCPGVSCPAVVGLSAKNALDICFLAGNDRRVALFDLSEFNPTIEDYRTGRLTASMFYYFAQGVCSRQGPTMSE